MTTRKTQSNNTSGYPGVYWASDRNRWRAKIKVDGEWRMLGTFKRIEEAAEARRAADAEHTR